MNVVFFKENLIGVKKDEDRVRRAAEREGRRIRRLKTRSLSASVSHVDGMSSDDEVTEMVAAAYRNQKGTQLHIAYCSEMFTSFYWWL